MKPPFAFLAFGLLSVLVACKSHPSAASGAAPAVQDAAAQAHSQIGLVGHWVCMSSQMPTGLFLFRTFDFHADGTFRSIDSMEERPPVRVWDGTWSASNSSITAKFRTWRVGAEETVFADEVDLGYGFIDQTKGAEAREEFRYWLSHRAIETIVMTPSATRNEAYEKVGFYVAEHSDVMIAVWDGLASQGRGGTAEIVARAKELGKPICHIWAGNYKKDADKRTDVGDNHGVVEFINFAAYEASDLLEKVGA